MKTPTIIYCSAIGLLNILLGLGLRLTSAGMAATYQAAFESHEKTLAPLSRLALTFHWWPYLVAALCGVSAWLYQSKQNVSCVGFPHALLCILILEAFALYLTLVAFILPFISFP